MSSTNEDLITYYRQRLTNTPVPGGNAGTESVNPVRTELSADGIKDKIARTTGELHRIITGYLDDRQPLHELADQLTSSGTDALKALADGDHEYLMRHQSAGTLEVIVRTDGSRPSFLIKNGKPDLQSSPAGTWSDVIDASGDQLDKALACVGRINLAGIHIGTGFLTAADYILTNRHVMQTICEKNNSGHWQLKAGATIDFGFEYRGRQSVMPRKITSVIYAGEQDIDPQQIDHAKLDLAILQLETAAQDQLPRQFLAVDLSSEWAAADSGAMIYTMGYPANPGYSGLAVYGTLLETLFHSTYGYKRLAPGMVINSTFTSEPRTAAHDASTLGGNSGSPVVRIGREMAVSGLHYGGSTRLPRENWCHILGKCLPQKGLPEGKTLKDILEETGIKLTDNY